MPNAPMLRITVRDVSGGANNRDHASEIKSNQSAVQLNAVVDRVGKISQRPGIATIADDVGNNAINSIQEFFRDNDATDRMMMKTSTVWYEWTGGATWTSKQTGLTDEISNQVVGNNEILLLSPSDNVFSYDGSSVTDELNLNADPPRTKFGIYHQNRYILSGNTASPAWFWYSDTLSKTFDRTSNAIKVSDGDGQDNTALVEFGRTDTPGFLVFKERSVFLVDSSNATPSNWTVTPIDNLRGCIAGRTALKIGNDVFYLAEEGIGDIGTRYTLRSLGRTQFDKMGSSGVLSDPIEDTLNDINAANVHKATAVHFNRWYILSIPTTNSYNDVICVLDLVKLEKGEKAWSVWTGISASDFAFFIVSGQLRLYGGEASANSIVYQMMTGTDDNGTNIDFDEQSKQYDFGSPEWKVGSHIELEFETKGATVSLSVALDGEDWQTLGDFDTSAAAGPTLPINLPFNLVGTNTIRKVYDLSQFGRFKRLQTRTEVDESADMTRLGYDLYAWKDQVESVVS